MLNFHCLRIHLSLQFTNVIFGKIRSVFISGSRILLLRPIVLFLFPKWSWTDSCPTLGKIWAFCGIQFNGFPVIANIDCARWNKLSLLRVINLLQARPCFSLLWWSQRISWCVRRQSQHPALRVVVTKGEDCLDIRALEEWNSEEVFSQFCSWKFLDL